jgi:hypothetical protein
MPPKKRRSAFAQYFIPFGFRQICDIMMLVAFVVLIVGMCVYASTSMVLLIGLAIFFVASSIAVARSIRILASGINKRSPEFKHALVNTILFTLLTVLAVVAFILTLG